MTSLDRLTVTRTRAALVPLLIAISVAIGTVTAGAETADTETAERPIAGCLVEGQPLAGRPLADVLRGLAPSGLRIVFSDLTVRPDMLVLDEPTAKKPRRQVDQLLAPHGLRVEKRAAGTLVVVRDPAAGNQVPVLAGIVRARGDRRPLAGVRVRVVGTGLESTSNANGRFAIADLGPGVYAVEAERWGYNDFELGGVELPDRGTDLTIAMDAAAYYEDSIVVRPSEQSLLLERPAAPLAISRGEIEILPHLGGDLFRALSLLPGLASNDVSAKFHIHGGRRDEVQIVLDGQELYEAFHLADFDSAMSIVAPQWLGSVNLSTGGFPARRGDRMSGVLDMTTASPTEDTRTDLSLSVLSALAGRAGSFGDGRGGWLATARAGSIELANRLLGREDPSFWDVFGKIEYRLDDRHSLRLHYLHADDALTFEEAIDGESKRLDTDYVSAYAWLSHQVALGRRFLVESRGSNSRIERNRRGIEDEEEQSFTLRDRRDLGIVGFEHSWFFHQAERRTFEWGVIGRRFEADYDYENQVERDIVLDSPLAASNGSTRFSGELRGEHLGLWTSARLAPLTPLTLEVGLRLDRHTLTDDTLLSPRTSAAWRIGDSSVVRASWGHFHQSHRANELQVEDGETRFFSAERSEHWVLGYERQFSGGDRPALRALRIEAYRRDIRRPRLRFENLLEPINTFPEVELDRVRIAPEASRARGIEVALRGTAGRQIDWWLNYTYSTIRDRLGGDWTRRQIDQPHTLNLDLNFALGAHWNVNLAGRLRSGWPTTPVTLEIESEDGEVELRPTLGRLNSQRLPTYHRLDLRASRRWPRPGGQLILFFDVQNVYDRKNLAGFDLTIDEDEMILIAEPERWAGILPSVGVRWTF